MNEAIYGTCTQMCPHDEIKLRESERLLHILEMIPGTELASKPKADRNRIVKMYTRSAAGLHMALPKNLRTTDALLQTIGYLLHDVISSSVLSWHIIYDFIADRLMAVRQDMLIQRLPNSHYIILLHPTIRFYAFAAYRLCELSVRKFDPVLNNIQLQECLKKLLTFYDDSEYLSVQCILSRNSDAIMKDYECIYADSRPFFESLYILFNLTDVSAILRGLCLKKQWRTEIVNKSLQISIAARNGNWYRACVLIKELPTLLAAIASLHLPTIRRDALMKMSTAYNSKHLTYPINVLKKQLLYNNKADVLADCSYYNVQVEEDAIKFTKGVINVKDLAKPKHEKFVDAKLSGKTVSSIVLEGDVY